jgi:hypothetical protein
LNPVIVTYIAFGLILQSNLPIPGLPVQSISALPDIDVHLGARPLGLDPSTPEPESLRFASAPADEGGEPILRIWDVAGGAFLHLLYGDGIEFWLDRRGTEVWAVWPVPFSVADVATYLLGPVLGLLLRLRGITCLHASAVAIDNRAVVFVGAAGAGKSTTAAALARAGWSVLADDIVAIQEQGDDALALPSFPYLSLWPESVDMLYGGSDALPRFTPHWEKRRLSLDGGDLHFQNRAVPLQAIYILGERTQDPAPHIDQISAQTALLSLVANTYATTLLDLEMRAKEFAVLGRVVAKVALRKLHAHRDSSRLADLNELIRKDIQAAPKNRD